MEICRYVMGDKNKITISAVSQSFNLFVEILYIGIRTIHVQSSTVLSCFHVHNKRFYVYFTDNNRRWNIQQYYNV